MIRCASLALIVLLATGLAVAAQPKSVTVVGQNNLRYSQEHITVAPGQKITVKLVNKSHLPASEMSQNWVLLKQGTNASAFNHAAEGAAADNYIPPSMTNRIIAHTGLVSGGHSDSVTFTAPLRPGDYTYICTFPGHFRAGMKGTLTVESDE